MKIGSLFSGYEGLGMGVQAVLGGDIAWVSDIDPGACKILAHRYPDVPNIGDITTVDWSQVEPVDVLTGGSPCQDVSAAGKRAGMRPGTRSGLWASMCDAIDIIRPSLVVWENVRGVLSAGADSAVEPCPICVGDERDSHLRALGRVVGDLAELGYVGRWTGLRAADVGAPHGRFRVFLTAWPAADAQDDGWERGRRAWAGRDGSAHSCDVDPDAAGLGRRATGRDDGLRAARLVPPAANPYGPGSQGAQPAAGRHLPDRCTPADADRDPLREQPVGLAGRSGQALVGHAGADAAADAGGDGREGCPERHQWSPGGLAASQRDDADRCTGAAADSSSDQRGPHVTPGRAGALEQVGTIAGPSAGDRAGDPPAGVRDVGGTSRELAWGPYAAAVRRWERLTRPAPAPTEPGKTGQPRLSPAFVEWMQGLPAGWVTDVPSLTRNEQLKALGNGVVPQQCAAALRLLLPDVSEAVA